MKLIFGTMNFGPQVDLPQAEKMISLFYENGFHEIDSAFVYNEGQTERMLGEMNLYDSYSGISISTKVNPRISGRLDKESIYNQFEMSLERLKLEKVDILYLHFPDPVTPLTNTLSAIAELYQKGKIKELGLSNFPAWMVVEIYYLCKLNGWPLPTVYQGMYNGFSRGIEKELMLALRKFGIRFYAYNPLAGGLLSGKYTNFKQTPSEGRFTIRPNYQGRYWKKSFFDALDILTSKCKNLDIPVSEAAYRWLAFHSDLDFSKGDGIIVGASKLDHVKQNIIALKKGILPEIIIQAFEDAWQEAKTDSPSYFRFITPTINN